MGKCFMTRRGAAAERGAVTPTDAKTLQCDAFIGAKHIMIAHERVFGVYGNYSNGGGSPKCALFQMAEIKDGAIVWLSVQHAFAGKFHITTPERLAENGYGLTCSYDASKGELTFNQSAFHGVNFVAANEPEGLLNYEYLILPEV